MLVRPHMIRIKEQIFININNAVSVAVEPDFIRTMKIEGKNVEQKVSQISFYFGDNMGLTFVVGDGNNGITQEDFDRIASLIKGLEYGERVNGNASTAQAAE